jgi:2-(1,2-epoxy-1,2-dihydrophenyl)acetyl-CoA isomerase
MTLLVESCPGYRRITLNRPERLNALNVEMAAALDAAFDEAAADKTCRALLLTGAGRGFCAGQDLTEIVGASPADLERLLEHYHPLILKIRALSIPVVCAVNGVAAGAGANLALACDIVLVARSATFVQAFARIGLIPDCGGTWFLPRLIGTARARALAFLAEPLPAETAAEWGLVWRMTEDERLLPEAEALAARLASQASNALALTKRALDATGENTLAQQLDLEGELQRQAGAHPDHAEGVRAFLEKRPAAFAKTRN